MKLLCNVQPPLATLTLNQPEARNPLSADVRDALREQLAELARDDAVRAVIITGAGEHFCAGGDIRTMGETDRDAVVARMSEVAKAALTVARFGKPLVAAVRGHAAGAGVSLTCLCDLALADTSARFTFAFLRIALVPDWGLSHTLPRRVGHANAKRLLLTRQQIDTDDAYRLGLVDVVTEPDDLIETARKHALHLADAPREGVSSVKALLGDTDALAAALERETAMQTERFLSWEHQEGVAAFREKRKPDFQSPR